MYGEDEDKIACTGPTSSQGRATFLYRHKEPNEQTKEGPLSFVFFGSPFASVSTFSRGHPSTLYSLPGPILWASPQRSQRLEDWPWLLSWPPWLEESGGGGFVIWSLVEAAKGMPYCLASHRLLSCELLSIINSSCGDKAFVLNHPSSLKLTTGEQGRRSSQPPLACISGFLCKYAQVQKWPIWLCADFRNFANLHSGEGRGGGGGLRK
jgi:hypothetical protein